jgi:hypothetical protein
MNDNILIYKFAIIVDKAFIICHISAYISLYNDHLVAEHVNNLRETQSGQNKDDLFGFSGDLNRFFQSKLH